MITKVFFEKQFKKRNKVTVYSEDSIAQNITREPCIRCDSVSMSDFDTDCSDLAEYCNHAGLALKPAHKN